MMHKRDMRQCFGLECLCHECLRAQYCMLHPLTCALVRTQTASQAQPIISVTDPSQLSIVPNTSVQHHTAMYTPTAPCKRQHAPQTVMVRLVHEEQVMQQQQYLWPVGRPHKEHPPFSAVGVTPLHLHQHLCLQSPTGLMLTCTTTVAFSTNQSAHVMKFVWTTSL